MFLKNMPYSTTKITCISLFFGPIFLFSSLTLIVIYLTNTEYDSEDLKIAHTKKKVL